MTGELKKLCATTISSIIVEFQQRRKQISVDELNEYMDGSRLLG